ncbi:MAG TPA: SAM-dependent methyltransferase [Rugosimonospora sp.]|nr:SAM-dependent methyltransferase [Rugosimonospora sp.]
MSQADGLEPPRFDFKTPSVARMYDYYLGGSTNFTADREVAARALSVAPKLRSGALEIRKFLVRAVRHLAESGIRQFVELGCGLPAQDSVHQVAQAVAPDARVVYVDNDPLVVSHTRWLETPSTRVVQADLREPEQLLAEPELRELIDFEQPVAILLIAVLHQISDDDLARHIVRTCRDAMASGSYLAIAHAVSDVQPEVAARLTALYQDKVGMAGPRRANLRTRAEVAPYFDGLELVEPGLVYVPDWRPDPDSKPPPSDEPVWAFGGVARKR